MIFFSCRESTTGINGVKKCECGVGMNNPTIQINGGQLVEALSQFPPDGLKKVIDKVFQRKLYSPPTVAEISRAASRTVKREKVEIEAVAEAVQWARSQK
jgi:hypothetical protein